MEGELPKELFISYGREPHVIAFVSRLKDDLEQNGFTVWLDLKDIPSGSDWHGAIGGGLYQCQAIIPIITTKYLSSSYCIKELYTADGDGKLIFPIMFENVDFDKDQTSQGVKFTISSINWTMCRDGVDDYNNSISRLIQDMKVKGLGNPGYSGPKVKVQLGQSAATTNTTPISVGPTNTSEPVLILRDVELPGGIGTGPENEIIYTSGTKHSVTICKGEEKLKEFGKCGIMEDEDMLNPTGVAVNDKGEIIVACQYFLKRFTLEGKYIGKVGDYKDPEGDLSLHGPQGLSIGKEGKIYVVEISKNRVKIFNSDFSFHSCFSQADKRLGSGHLNNPMDLAINSKGEVFVADLSNNVIQVFTHEGEFIFRFGKQGHTLGCIQAPMAIAIDQKDYVYVACGTGVVSMFEIREKDAVFVKAFGSHGAELGQFNVIKCMHIDRNGRLHVGEMTNKRIQVFQ